MSAQMAAIRVIPAPGASDCEGPLHPQARHGIDLFNVRQYWQAHEALEAAWRAEPGQARHLYRGILQVGVAYLHIQRGNYPGALKLYHRSLYWLAPFPEVCRGVPVAQLRIDLEAAIAEARRLGADRLREFDPVWLKPIELVQA